MQMFFPASADSGAVLRLSEDGAMEIRGKLFPFTKSLIRRLIGICRSLGAYTLPPLVQTVFPGHGIHYAGTLPMTQRPESPYHCTSQGELSGEPNVFVADAALFPVLPAKNFSFAVMANAMRIADIVNRGMKA